MKFVFTCGGTAGHINPALAVALYLKENLPDTQFLFIGALGQMEMELVPREGYDIKGLKITNISREKSLEGLLHNAETVSNVLSSTVEARRILKEFAPDVVIGTGGYVCYPVIMAAHRLGIPTVIHESNAGPGLTTRMLSKVVDKILVGVEGCAHEYSDPSKVVVTGTPVRGAFSLFTRESARAELGLPEDEPLVLSVWGSLGAGRMNEFVLKMLPSIEKEKFHFIHVTGSRYYDDFMREVVSSVPDYAENGIEIFEYLHDMARVMTAADCILCRAGASTLSELTFMGKPAILVPSPNVVDNHQEKNARVLEAAGGARVLLESEMNEDTLLKEIVSLISDSGRLEQMSACMKKAGFENSAEKIANEILSLTGR